MNTVYHSTELTASAIEENLGALNIESQSAAALEEFLLLHSDGSWQAEAGYARQSHRRRYDHLRHGGWKVEGCDWETGEPSGYGRVKPNHPFIAKDGKAIKYESQKGGSSHPFYPRMTYRAAYECADRQGVTEQFTRAVGVTSNPYSECKQFWQFWHNRGLPVAITEGEKKALSLCSHGVATIGIGGIWMLRKVGERETLHPELASFLLKGTLISIFFDEDAKDSTREAVAKASREAYRLLSKHGCAVRFAGWNPGEGKGIDDYLANGHSLDVLMEGVASYHQMKRNQSQLLHNAKIIQKDWNLDRYINPISEIRWHSDKMTAIKAPKGAGKSSIIPQLRKLLPALYLSDDEWLRIISERGDDSELTNSDYAELNKENYAIFGITYRQSLEGECCEKWGLDAAESFKRIGVNPLACGGTVACIDSIHSKGKLRTEPERFEDTPVILVIDEVRSVIDHLLSSRTDVRKHRVDSLHRLTDILGAVARNPHGRIIIMDADLRQWEVDFIRELAGIDKGSLGVYDFQYKHVIRRTAYRHKSSESIYLAIKKSIEEGQKILIHTDRQKGDSSWSSTGLESMLTQSLTQSLSLLRVDAETLSDPEHAAFGALSHLEELTREYSCLVMSPSVETGVSISRNVPIDAVFYLGSGVVTVAAALQTIERYRGDCDRHYFVPKKASQGQRMKGNGSSSPYSVIRGERDKAGITDSQLKRQMSDLKKLEDFDASICIDGNSPAAFLWAQYAAEENDMRRDYRRYFEEGIERDGYEIIDINSDDDDDGERKAIRDEMKAKKDELTTRQSEEVAVAVPIDSDEATKLADSRSLSKEKRNSLKQYKVAKAFALNKDERPSPEQCAQYFDGTLIRAGLHYRITTGRQVTKRLQCIEMHKEKEHQPEMFIWDCNDNWQEWLYSIMETLDIPKLLNLLSQEGKRFHLESPELQPYMDRFLQLQQSRYSSIIPGLSKATSDQILGNGKSGNAIEWVQVVLRRLGLPTLKCVKRDCKNGVRRRLYEWEGISQEREELFGRWLERDRERIEDFEWQHTRRQRYEASVAQMEAA